MSGRLDSWKEIAAYLKRGTRTVQRWEREEGLPVHRLVHDKLGSVYAYTAEIDAWFAGRKGEPETKEASIAVLPFADMSRERDQGYFCEGMAEEILNALSRVRGLRVASRMSSFQFGAEAADVREVGRRLRVASVLEGSVRKSDGGLRIGVRLSDAATGFQSWSGSYDRPISHVFAVQDEIAMSVARELEVTLVPGRPATNNVEAYDLYLRGRSFYYRYGPRDVQFALEMFTRAIERDPQYVLAHAGVADCWSYLFMYANGAERARQEADAAARRAVELDPASAQAQASRALAYSINGCDPQAETAFETAMRLDPGLFEAYYFYARHAFVRGQREKALGLYERAIEARPEDFQAPLLMAQIYEDLGRKDEADASRRRGIELAKHHLTWNPDDARATYMAANGLAGVGELAEGSRWADRALAIRPDDSMVLYNCGCVYSMAGELEKALKCLEDAVHYGLTQRGWFENDSNLDPLRGYTRFQELVARLEPQRP
ncbi:MAG: hypothetical protein ACE15B_06830 [Bryobacteraceae bacterium]